MKKWIARFLLIIIFFYCFFNKFFVTLIRGLNLSKSKVKNHYIWFQSLGPAMGDAIVENYVFHSLKKSNYNFYKNIKQFRYNDIWDEIYEICDVFQPKYKHVVVEKLPLNVSKLFSAILPPDEEHNKTFKILEQIKIFIKVKKSAKNFVKKNNIDNCVFIHRDILTMCMSIYTKNSYCAFSTIDYPLFFPKIAQKIYFALFFNLLTFKNKNKYLPIRNSITHPITQFDIYKGLLRKFFNIDVFFENPLKKVIKKTKNQDFYTLIVKSSSISKDWSLDNWISLINIIFQNTSLTPVLVGSKKDVGDLNYIKSKTNCSVNLSIDLTIEKMLSIFKSSKFIVSTDTGPAHVASLVNAKCLVILAEFWSFFPYPENTNTNLFIFPKLSEITNKPFNFENADTLYSIYNNIKYRSIINKVTPKVLYDKIKSCFL